jgi:hypothetical protein
VVDGATVGLLVELKLPSTKPNTRQAFTYTADVSDAGGTGSVVFSVGRFTGDPLTAADGQAYDMYNCQAPKRHVLADGTVLQIYDVAPSDPFASLNQTLRIYLPDGQLYSLSVRNFGSPDFATNREDPGHPHRVGAGRPTLPLTERQLAELGLAMAGCPSAGTWPRLAARAAVGHTPTGVARFWIIGLGGTWRGRPPVSSG